MSSNRCYGVWIFLDDSNLWIEGKKLRGGLMNNKFFKEDPRGRVSLRTLEKFALDGRTLESAILYGSEPPAVESYWKNAKRKGWTVREFHRSIFNKKEKEVDCAMSVDITKTVYSPNTASEKYDDGKRVIVLISGDKDLRPAIEGVISLKGKWKVEIVGYKHSMSNELIKLGKFYDEIVKIRFLGSNFTFIEYDLKLDDLKSFEKFRYGCVFYGVKPEVSEDDLIIYLDELKWPYQRGWINDSGEKRNYFVLFSHPDQEIENCPIDLAIDQNLSRLRNNKELSQYCTKIISYQEFTKAVDFSHFSILPISNKFNVLSDDCGLSIASSCDSFYIGEDGNDSGLGGPSPETKSLENIAITCDQKLVQMGSMLEWQSVNSDLRGKTFQCFTKSCDFGFGCKYKLKCRYSHTIQEKDHFKSGTPSNYKTKFCRNLEDCSYGNRCLFAHSQTDLFCSLCADRGHDREACLAPKNSLI